MNEKLKPLVHYLELAANLENPSEVNRWSLRVGVFLREVLGDVAVVGFTSLQAENEWDELALRRGYLEGLLVKFEEESSSQGSSGARIAIGEVASAANTRAIFLVHGHDGEAKETVARFLEKLELEPIILHEQPNQGRTLIEKFETSSRGVAFAVVLLTPDDLGGAAHASPDLRPRARQNVILELGYFMGRLGRTRVCALYKGGVELPSDFQGVVYIEFDSAGAWKTKLAQEFIEAKLPIKLEGLINK